MDSLFFGLSLNICAHFDFLRVSFNGDKKKFAQRHKIILELAEDLNKFYQPVVLVQFLISSTLLCVIGFQLVVLESFFKRIICAIFGFGIIIQLFIYSYGGQIIIDKSSAVADDFYQLDRDLIIIIARAQKAQTIKSGFYEANLPTFKSILGAAASLITLLKSFIE